MTVSSRMRSAVFAELKLAQNMTYSYLRKGHHSGYQHSHWRTCTESPIVGLCEIQDLEQASTRPRCEPWGLLLVQ